MKSPPYLHLNPSNKVLPPDKQEVLANEDELRVTKIAFELLPKGTWDIEDLISHFRGAAKHNPGVFNESAFEWERIVRLKSLRPIECFIGTEAWFGYIVLTFSYSSKVVLECPMEGNATYVLTRYWRQMVRHTKGEMRSKFPGQFTRIVHRGDWLGRIKSAIEI